MIFPQNFTSNQRKRKTCEHILNNKTKIDHNVEETKDFAPCVVFVDKRRNYGLEFIIASFFLIK